MWNPVWFPRPSLPITCTQKESCIFYLDFPGFVDLCLLLKWVLNEVLILQIIAWSLVFIEMDTTWLLRIKGILGGNSVYFQTFCVLYSFQKKYIYLFYFKDWEEEHTCKDVCRGAQMPQHTWRSEDSFLGSVLLSSAEPSLQTSWNCFKNLGGNQFTLIFIFSTVTATKVGFKPCLLCLCLWNPVPLR